MKAKLNKIAIALGGNLGDSKTIFCSAVSELSKGGVENIKKSALFHSKPENCPPDSPDFTNAALIGEWAGSPEKLLKLCQQIEISAGRPTKHDFNAPRLLDLDIILFGSKIISSPTLQIPHPRATSRLFVLEPLAEIASDWIFPGINKTVKQIKQSCRESCLL
jgi:2-amino-4-hydroxy-6-hydroxymethyldihydropteridine diphosphokinase